MGQDSRYAGIDRYTTNAGDRWRIRYERAPDPVTSRRRQTTRRGYRSEREARRALREAIGAVDEGRHVDPSRATVAEYLSSWVAGVQVRPTTQARYRQSVERHLIPHIGASLLQALTTEDLDRCYRTLEREGGRQGQPLAPKTVRHAHTTLRTALQAAVDRGYVARNIADHANPPKLVRLEVHTWTAPEVRRFLEHVRDGRWYAMWLLYFTTGMRRGEVLGLRWDDVDLDAGKVVIRHVLTRVDGRTISTEPKTAKGRRTIALDAATVVVLREWRQHQLEEQLAAGPAWQNRDLVFTWPDGSFVHPNLPTKWIRKLADQIGLPRIRLHDARHSFATLALESGVDVKIVSERLGHANTSVTRDVYQHVSPAMDQEAADRVSWAIFGGSG